ncbi:MAG TPA: hypothetical protein VFP83_01255 [Candidatus Limnocylindria bacterium]|nr:hypothetical protein [Candidatus Limnocylindria bacterium]
MAGTLPHAVFVETDIDADGTAAAFAGELPGCAAVAADPGTAVAALPARVGAFVAWLRGHGESLVEPVGNWYEVERAAAVRRDGATERASFSLDDLPPSPSELQTWLRWAELAREDLAVALDAQPGAADDAAWLADQDLALAADLGTGGTLPAGLSGLDRLYAARDRLMDGLSAGPQAGVRRALRLAIADDLRLVEHLRGR